MNGFLYIAGTRDGSFPEPGRIAPLTEERTCHVRTLPDGGRCIAWGHASGDIHFAERQNEAFLVLSGYISEFESGPGFSSQEEAARCLLAGILAVRSDAEIEHLLGRAYGSFGIVFRDTVRDITICATDRVSSRPIWRSWQRQGWILSSHVAAIALADPSPGFDLAGLGSFLLYGGPVSPTRSLFRGIRGAPPGSIVRLGAQGEHASHRWYRFRHSETTDLTVAEWTRQAADRLLHAAARIGREGRKPAIFFSGGTDSRLAASAMKSAGCNPLLVTLCDGKNLEVRAAQLASRALGLDHAVIVRDRHWYLRGLPSAVYETGGNYVWTHGHFSAAAAKVQKEQGADVFLLGDFCDAFSKLFCSLGRAEEDFREAEEFVRVFDRIRLPLYRPPDRDATLSLFNAAARNRIADAVRSDIEDRFREIRPLARDPRIAGDLCFRWESANSLPTFFMFLDLRSMAAERSLMFDRDVHRLLETMPAGMRDGNNLGDSVIYRLQPMAAWAINANSMLPMIFPPVFHKMTRRVKPVLGKVRRFLIGNSHRTTGSWPEHSALYSSDPRWRKCFDDILGREELFDEGIFDIGAIRKCREDFADGRICRQGDIEKLMQLGLTTRLMRDGATRFMQETPSW
jgi:hypothetical protein